jgi:hypothetical protein
MGGLEEAKKTERWRNQRQKDTEIKHSFNVFISSRIVIERHTHYNRKNRFGPHNPVQINICWTFIFSKTGREEESRSFSLRHYFK